MNSRIRSLVARWTGGLLAVQFLLSGLCLMPQGAHAAASATMSPAAMSGHCSAMMQGEEADNAMMHASGAPMHGCAHCDQPDATPTTGITLEAPVFAPLALLAGPVVTEAETAASLPAAWPDDSGPASGAALLYRTTQRLLI